jgi:hypothetical protein
MRKTMNNSANGRVDQKDRELEELLCLAYLFTHTESVQGLGDSEDPLAENVGMDSARGMYYT